MAVSKAESFTARLTIFSYNIVKDPVHLRDWHATILHLMSFDYEHFTYKVQGLDGRLTGVEEAHVMQPLLV